MVDTAGNRGCPVVVQVEVELADTCIKLELFEEERVVLGGKRVEDVEVGLTDT